MSARIRTTCILLVFCCTALMPQAGAEAETREQWVKRMVASEWHGDDAKAFRIIDCETGGTYDPRIVSKSGTYRGIWQFDLETWRSVQGLGNPEDASPEGQTIGAWRLYQKRGYAPWPSCGKR